MSHYLAPWHNSTNFTALTCTLSLSGLLFFSRTNKSTFWWWGGGGGGGGGGGVIIIFYEIDEYLETQVSIKIIIIFRVEKKPLKFPESTPQLQTNLPA